ncbi:cupin domain-containing protein [Conexibacter stalactiti]|uniref:Cupin domain-containing protein n=1 Tax=Conexibacter stalactiti TaxID=1940611 RepID=A0ABU4HJA5_9ACTN|nr:cupin domain-containing protein [Conexibacter stalactiti]MDW5593403.1 cupin domain-containing protein [Conexibacter stalactiti]MEC5034044.1 cupin domain-containing protein [Conexibacter stalactiti]
MSIDQIAAIDREHSTPFVPTWAPEDVGPEGFREVERRCFASADGALFGGLWEGEPGTLRVQPYPYDEICVILSGRVALVDEQGGRREFGAGDAFFVPRSFSGTWETLEPSEKIFVGYDPRGEGA